MKLGNIYLIRKKISNLNGSSVMNNISINQLRKNTEILIIDDEEFSLLDMIKKHGFNVHHKKDIDDIKDLQPYDIVLCDIRGVGKIYDSTFEGAYVIKEERINYPNKQIIAYTASSYNAEYNKYLSCADAIVPKGTSPEDWVSLLDEQLFKCVDPVFQWGKMRGALLEAGMDTIDVAKIEALYVKAIEEKDFTSLKALQNNKNKAIRPIISEFLSSLIVKYLSGGF